MNTYESTKIMIQSGNFEKENMMKKLDIFLNFDRISLEQYQELVEIMKGIQNEYSHNL